LYPNQAYEQKSSSEPDLGQPLAGFYLQNLGDHSLLHEVN
jgi:hypothetical protein